ncbi:MAG: hypothetical protein EXR79_12765 [Myxococcales bacterium]|nr:hypothetical protein [Myxococcales bacterium]
MPPVVAIAILVTLTACASAPPASTAAAAGPDASAGVDLDVPAADAGTPETSRADAATTEIVAATDAPPSDLSIVDTAKVDTTDAPFLTAWGKISGACGDNSFANALQHAGPTTLMNYYTFSSTGPFDAKPLRPKAFQRRNGPNNGGSSNCSEAMSIQTICDCFGAKPLKTEVEITWTAKGQTTDWLGEVYNMKFGVSVSRIYLGPTATVYTAADAKKLLEKKLGGIIESSRLVAPADKWHKQVLHLWTLRADWATTVRDTFDALDPKIKADTVLLITIEQGSEHIVKETCKP